MIVTAGGTFAHLVICSAVRSPRRHKGSPNPKESKDANAAAHPWNGPNQSYKNREGQQAAAMDASQQRHVDETGFLEVLIRIAICPTAKGKEKTQSAGPV